jgi:hypothetical protein
MHLSLSVAPAGKRVSDVAPKLAAAVEPFGVNLVEGVMSHQMKQFVIDGNKVRRSNAYLCTIMCCNWRQHRFVG